MTHRKNTIATLFTGAGIATMVCAAGNTSSLAATSVLTTHARTFYSPITHGLLRVLVSS